MCWGMVDKATKIEEVLPECLGVCTEKTRDLKYVFALCSDVALRVDHSCDTAGVGGLLPTETT